MEEGRESFINRIFENWRRKSLDDLNSTTLLLNSHSRLAWLRVAILTIEEVVQELVRVQYEDDADRGETVSRELNEERRQEREEKSLLKLLMILTVILLESLFNHQPKFLID